jgi:hypothetical protein
MQQTYTLYQPVPSMANGKLGGIKVVPMANHFEIESIDREKNFKPLYTKRQYTWQGW